MTTKDLERDALLKQAAAEGEAGVADLLALYERIEAVYIAAAESMESGDAAAVSDSTSQDK